jgi:hypothetical protein
MAHLRAPHVQVPLVVLPSAAACGAFVPPALWEGVPLERQCQRVPPREHLVRVRVRVRGLRVMVRDRLRVRVRARVRVRVRAVVRVGVRVRV